MYPAVFGYPLAIKTWKLKILHEWCFNLQILYKWWILHCYVWPEGNPTNPTRNGVTHPAREPFLIHGLLWDAPVVYMVVLIHHSLGTWLCQLAKQDEDVCFFLATRFTYIYIYYVYIEKKYIYRKYWKLHKNCHLLMWKRCSPTTNTWTDSKYLRPLTFKRGKSNQRLKEKTAEELINTNTNPRKLAVFEPFQHFRHSKSQSCSKHPNYWKNLSFYPDLRRGLKVLFFGSFTNL